MPIQAGSLHYAVGPVVAVVVLLLLALFMRWAFGPGAGRRPSAPAGDGLLTPVATVPRREQALMLRAVLSDAGIRSTVRDRGPLQVDVLVFPEDLPRARALAAPFPRGD